MLDCAYCGQPVNDGAYQMYGSEPCHNDCMSHLAEENYRREYDGPQDEDELYMPDDEDMDGPDDVDAFYDEYPYYGYEDDGHYDDDPNPYEGT